MSMKTEGLKIQLTLSGARIADITMAKMKSVVQRAIIRLLAIGSVQKVKKGEAGCRWNDNDTRLIGNELQRRRKKALVGYAKCAESNVGNRANRSTRTNERLPLHILTIRRRTAMRTIFVRCAHLVICDTMHSNTQKHGKDERTVKLDE